MRTHTVSYIKLSDLFTDESCDLINTDAPWTFGDAHTVLVSMSVLCSRMDGIPTLDTASSEAFAYMSTLMREYRELPLARKGELNHGLPLVAVDR